MSTPFIDETVLGTYLGLDLSADERAIFAVDAACETVRSVTEQGLDALTDDEIVLDGTGTDVVLLPQFPVANINSVLIDGVTLDPSNYSFTERGMLIRVDHCVWPRGRQNITVDYDHGYDEIPSSVNAVAIALAARIYSQQIVSQETVGGVSTTYSAPEGGLTKHELRVLAKYASRA